MGKEKNVVITNVAATEKDGPAVANDPEVVEKGTLPAEEENRAVWGNKLQFMLATMGFAAGLGSVWRFPYLCQKNGGGAFLIPYIISIILLGVPLFFLELAIGQRLRKGTIGVWNEVSPKLAGIGITTVMTSCFLFCYYSMIIGWCFYYLFVSFQEKLPYQHCPNMGNWTAPECELAGKASYYWYRVTLDTTESIDESGGLQLHLCLALLVGWVVAFFCVIKGVKSAGKAVYFTATFPYVVLIIFFFRGVTLDGADVGLKHMFMPRFDRLADTQVWLDAVSQTFFTFSLGCGGLIAMASYNPMNNNCKRDAILVSIVSSVVSIFASAVVFSILGFKATSKYNECRNAAGTSLKVDSVCETLEEYLNDVVQGSGLIFIAFTEAITLMPVPQLWAILFFCMLLTLGTGGMLGLFTGILTPLLDIKPFPIRKEFYAGMIAVVACIFSLVFCQRSGEYWVQLFDSTVPFGLLIVGLVELIAVNYVYGTNRFIKDIEVMIGSKPGWFWIITWKFIAPLIVSALLIASFVSMGSHDISYTTWDKALGKTVENVPYPTWAVAIFAFLMFSMTIWIPLVAILRCFGLNIGNNHSSRTSTLSAVEVIPNCSTS